MKKTYPKSNIKRRISNTILILLLLLFPGIASAQLSGSYTIGDAQDYPDIASVITALEADGISGPVEFNIIPGTYEVHVTMNQVLGASETNTITFQSSTQDSSDVILRYSPVDQNDNWVLLLNGVDHARFQHLTFKADGLSLYGTCLWLDGMCDDLQFSNNAFLSKEASDATASRIICRVKIDNHLNEFFRDIHFTNNYFYLGSHAIFMQGYTYDYLLPGIVITGNVFKETGYCCAFLNGSVNPVITDNYMEAKSYGIRITSEYAGAVISRNRIYSDHHGIEMTRLNSNWPNRSLISNNYVTLSTSGNYGISISNSIHTDVLSNNVWSRSTSWQGAAFYSAYAINTIPTVTVKNNNFCCENASYSLIVMTENVIGEMTNNNLYTAGNYIAKWGADQLFDLKELQERSGLNENSVCVYPSFVSDEELRPLTPWLDGKGIADALVETDMAGEVRPDPPDIGAIEFTPDPSTMPPLDGSIEYTIGAGGVYPDFASAMEDAMVRGISAPVTFGFLEGTYDGQFEMLRIPGSGDDKRVTVQSASTNAHWAKLRYEATGLDDNYVFRLYGADFITLKNLYLEAKGSQYARVINLYLGTDSIHIENDTLRAPRNTNAVDRISHIYSADSDFRNREIRNNYLKEGAISIYMRRDQNNFKYPTGCVISNNEFDNVGYSGMYLQFYKAPVITSNMINSYSKGIQALSCSDDLRIQKNWINMESGDGIYMSTCVGNEDYKGLISNNFIHCGGVSGANGISINGSPWQWIFNNSINITNTNANSRPFYMASGAATNIRIFNNIFSHKQAGYALYTSLPSAIAACDNNDYYTLSNYLAYWGENVTDLAALQTLNGMDANSIVCNPQFVSDSDLHTSRECLDSAGHAFVAVPDDIDGDMRDPDYPDIGADEFGIVPNQPPYVDKAIPDQEFPWNSGVHEIALLDTVFIDPDPGDVLSYSASSSNAGVLATIENNVLKLASGEGFAGTADITVTATDPEGESADDIFMVEFVEVIENHPPVAVNDTVITGKSVTIEVLENDYDPDGDELFITDYEYHGPGTVDVINMDKDLYYIPGAFVESRDTILYIIEDRNGGYDTGYVYIQLYIIQEGFYDIEVEGGLTGLSHGSIKWGDYDGDENLDLLQTGWTGLNFEFRTFVYQNTGEGFSILPLPFLGVSSGTSSGADWIDFDNDNDLDFCISGLSEVDGTSKKLIMYENLGDGWKTYNNFDFDPMTSSSLAWGDVNLDGRPDLMVVGSGESGDETRLYKGDGDSGSGWDFHDVDTGIPGSDNGEVTLIDLDKDFHQDIFICGTGMDHCKIYFLGVSPLQETDTEIPGMYNSSVAWADINNDSYPDLAIMGTDGTQLYLQIWKNTLDNDDQVIFELVQELTGMESGDLAWADFDNDGDMDLAVTGNRSGFQPFTAIFRNDEGTFFDIEYGLADLGRSSLDWGDYDNDGDLDLALQGISGTGAETHIYRNDLQITNEPPYSIQSMSTVKEGDYYIISWGPGSDDITPEASLAYNVMFGYTAFTGEIISPMAESYFLKKTYMGNAGYNRSIKLLSPGPGEYFCRVQTIDQGFRSSDFSEPGWLVITGTEEEIPGGDPGFYPNPADRVIFLETANTGNQRVCIYDLSGKAVLAEAFSGQAGEVLELEVICLKPGIYIIELQDEHQNIRSKLIIER